MNRKFKIIIEGNGEGAGKTTIINKIKEEYSDVFDFVVEPDQESRKVLFKEGNQDLPIKEKIKLFKDSRDRTNKNCSDKKVIISDRGAMSSYVYQGIVSGTDENRQDIINYIKEENKVVDEYYIVLMNDYETLKSRRLASGRVINTYDLLPDSFHKDVFNGYEYTINNFGTIFGHDRLIVVDCKGKSVDEVYSLVKDGLERCVTELIFTAKAETKSDNNGVSRYPKKKPLIYKMSGFELDIPTYNIKVNGRSIIDVLSDIFNNIGYESTITVGASLPAALHKMKFKMKKEMSILSDELRSPFKNVFRVKDELICEFINIISHTIYQTRINEDLELETVKSIVTKEYFDRFAVYSKNDMYTILSLFQFNTGATAGLCEDVVLGSSPIRFSPIYDKGDKIEAISTYDNTNPKGKYTFNRHTCTIVKEGLSVTNVKHNFNSVKQAIDYYKI